MPETPDFIVTNLGTIVLIRPVTDAAKAWVEENVEIARQQLGDAFGCDHRAGWGLVDVIEDTRMFIVEIQH